ncbi:MAG TPA: hypothetical protein DEG47_16340, partial [Cyanobacteria bacterium UBA11148]|nr:hypothetical protein [Cyanobacteria bacterium UBA11148]
ELWRFEKGKLQINVLRDGKYVEVECSPNFRDLLLTEVIPQYLRQSKLIGRNKAMREFRDWVRKHI